MNVVREMSRREFEERFQYQSFIEMILADRVEEEMAKYKVKKIWIRILRIKELTELNKAWSRIFRIKELTELNKVWIRIFRIKELTELIRLESEFSELKN